MRSKIDGVINFIFEEIGIKGKVVIRENWLMKRFCVSRDDVWKIIDVVMKEMYDDMVGASKAYNRNKFDYKEPFTYFATKCKGWKINTDNSAWLANKLFVLSSDSMLHNINKYEK